jgi:hypothetical protein
MMLSPEELAVVESLSMPIAYDQRAAFIAVVAEAMANQKVRGPGAVHRLAATIQLGFIRTSVQVSDQEKHAAQALFGASGWRTARRGSRIRARRGDGEFALTPYIG